MEGLEDQTLANCQGARGAQRRGTGSVPPGREPLRQCMPPAERSGDGPACWPAREGLDEYEDLPLQGSVQRGKKNWVGQGCWPGTPLTGLKSKETEAAT
jgi:hypothetical protein